MTVNTKQAVHLTLKTAAIVIIANDARKKLTYKRRQKKAAANS